MLLKIYDSSRPSPDDRARPARLGGDQRGASAVEYALLVSMIAIASLMAFQLSGNAVAGTMNNAAQVMPASGNAEIPPTPKG